MPLRKEGFNMKRLENIPNPINMDKKEVLDLLLKEEYGYLPSSPYAVEASEGNRDEGFFGGKAILSKMKLHFKAEWGNSEFTFYYVRPKRIKEPVPAFIHINFRDLIPDKYQPTEEIIDAGYAIFTIYYNDVTTDNGDFTNGIAGVLYPDGTRKPDQCGKIGLWAWSASAVMDYVQTLPEIRKDRVSVIGHSRLGKTALLAGATDERFFCAISNDSGNSGAALSRITTGEKIRDITRNFPYWFCENYRKYIDKENELPFDQNYLIAANVPHKVYVASAVGDGWACPDAEYLSCVAASEYYVKNGLKGFEHPDRLPEIGDVFHNGDIAYHMRDFGHALNRTDWNHYIDYLNSCK